MIFSSTRRRGPTARTYIFRRAGGSVSKGSADDIVEGLFSHETRLTTGEMNDAAIGYFPVAASATNFAHVPALITAVSVALLMAVAAKGQTAPSTTGGDL